MQETSFWAGSADGTRRFVRRWKPDAACRGIVHLIHGMAEHTGRYTFLGEKLADAGFEMWAADQRGHGKTADLSVNDAGRGGLLGHTCDRDGFFQVVRDAAELNALIAETHAGAVPPLFILGHSWGSFIAQGFIESLGESAKAAGIAGAVLSGTRGPGGAEIVLGDPFLAALAAFTGPRRPSRLAHTLAIGSYNKAFKPNRSAFDWLSRDEAEIDAFAADPLCGQMCSAGFFRDMIRGLAAVHKKSAIRGIPSDLPVYIFCGSDDPVGKMGEGPTNLMNAYRERGITDLEFVIYPNARHEPLNETNREEVCGDLLNWLGRHS
jgi:alpha-beta hydrolase superfamily lysophospholipase